MARSMGRNPGTLSRECRRGWLQRSYDAVQGGGWARSHRRHGPRKLLPGNPLTEQVHELILERTWSPEQIAGRLRVEHPDDSSQRVSHETVYQYIYAHPAGALKKLLVDASRQGHQKRRPRSRGKDRRGGIRNMRSIRERSEEAQSRAVPGHWEGDLHQRRLQRECHRHLGGSQHTLRHPGQGGRFLSGGRAGRFHQTRFPGP